MFFGLGAIRGFMGAVFAGRRAAIGDLGSHRRSARGGEIGGGVGYFTSAMSSRLTDTGEPIQHNTVQHKSREEQKSN